MAEIVRLLVGQVYEFRDADDGHTYYWNASEGRKLAERRAAEYVTVYLEDLGMTAERILQMYPDLDRRKALAFPGVALLSPILFVPHRGKHVLVDGWHRLYRAAVSGMPCLPAYVLTPDEERSIRLTGRDL